MAKQRVTTPTIDQIVEFSSVRSPRISPDGARVVYILGETDWEADRFTSRLWVVRSDGRDRRQLTFGNGTDTEPRWSPDGRTLAFLRSRKADSPSAHLPHAAKEGKAAKDAKDAEKDDGENGKDGSSGKVAKQQIWLIHPDGGEARRLTNSETAVSSFSWSPDGKKITYQCAAPEPRARKQLRKTQGDYRIFDEDVGRRQLWITNVRTGKSETLVDAPDQSVVQHRWSPDGKKIALVLGRDDQLKNADQYGLHVLTVATKRTKRLLDPPGPHTDPFWSPDGKKIAFATVLGQPDFYHALERVAVVLAGGGDPVCLTESFDEDVQAVQWDEHGIVFGALHRMSSHLFRLDPETRAISRVTGPDDFIGYGYDLTPDGSTAVCVTQDTTSLPEITIFATGGGAAAGSGNNASTEASVAASARSATRSSSRSQSATASPATFAPRRLTEQTRQTRRFTFGTREPVQWKSKDGTEVEGVLYKPVGFDPKRKYPLLVVIHGGPSSVSRPVLDPRVYVYPVEHWLAKGAVVLNPNYRGSTGYGQKFRKRNVRNLGVGDMWDVLSGVDQLARQGFVDTKRMGAMGWSQGGYISAFLATHTDRFRAISVGAGISNWVTYYVQTDVTPFTIHYLGANPWDDPRIYAKTSPMTNIRNASTPTLIQHGELDLRVPTPNAYELRQGLEDQSVPVKMILYTGQGHGLGTPKLHRGALEHNREWFDKWVFGESGKKAGKGAAKRAVKKPAKKPAKKMS